MSSGLDIVLSIIGIGGTLLIVIILAILSGLKTIGRYEVGIRTRKMFGKKMPQGRIIACDDSEVGILADTLMPGLYWFNPIIWKVEKEKVTTISEDQIGIVESVDGEPIPIGRLLADEVECNHFQDAKAFLNNKGRKGPQVAILRPGKYRINIRAFTVQNRNVTTINEEKIGVVKAMDGQPLWPGYIIAPKPENDYHSFFQDGQAFINAKGFRGPQLDTLQPGKYYINPLLFEVREDNIAEVGPGYVAVLVSNVGKELVSSTKEPSEISEKPDFKQSIHEKDEVVLTADKAQRGIWGEPVATGKYNMNPLAFTPYLVPTSAVTIDWAASTDLRTDKVGLIERVVGKMEGREVVREGKKRGPPTENIETEKATEFFKFSQLTLTSKDGFKLEADVRMIIRIRPQHAPFIIARFGSVRNLIEQIIHPLIDSSFRNKAGEKKAIEFIQSRTALQQEALEKAKEEFDKYYVEAQNLLISYIEVDEKLLQTQTEKEIAVQQQAQFEQQAMAQEKNTELQKKIASASKQKDVIDAKLSIEIEKDKAQATREKAMGERDATKYKAEGEAYAVQEVGKGTAKAYESQASAIGRNNLALIKLLQEISTGKIKIVPDFLIQGGGDGTSGNLFNAWLATMMKDQVEKNKEAKEE